MIVKIAAITEDGETISWHFGRALYYAVLTVEEGQVVKQELRDKLGHREFGGQEAHKEGERHGYGPDAGDRHSRMAAAISDCELLLCRGMGWGAYEAMRQYDIRPIVTDIAEIDAAVRAYLDGEIIDHTERLH